MKVLIVGLGSIGIKHIHALMEIEPDAELYALRSSSNSEVTRIGVVNIYSWNEVNFAPDFIIISNPTKFHYETIRQALKYNCPLFIEKPVVCSLEEAEELRQIMLIHNAISYVACNLRFHPVIMYLKQYLKDQFIEIYEVNIYCGSYLPDWRPNSDYSQTYSASKEYGGGVHLDLIHELDYCYWLFGAPKESVNVKRKVSDLMIDSYDSASYILSYSCFNAAVTLNYFRRDSKRTIEIVTRKGTIFADLLKCQISGSGRIEFSIQGFSMLSTYTDQMKYFISEITKQTKPMNSVFEAIEVIKIALK